MKLYFEAYNYEDSDIEFFEDELQSAISDLYGLVDHHLIPKVLRKLASGKFSDQQIIALSKDDTQRRDIKDILLTVSSTIDEWGYSLPRTKLRAAMRSCAEICDMRNDDIDNDNED